MLILMLICSRGLIAEQIVWHKWLFPHRAVLPWAVCEWRVCGVCCVFECVSACVRAGLNQAQHRAVFMDLVGKDAA